MDFEAVYATYQEKFNAHLQAFCDRLRCRPDVLTQSLRYSLQLGGKRVRPVLMLASGDLLGIPQEKLLDFALALELIHTYSLIHDDLPAMDNDDFRRGKPSNHKVFGEANAILAGDGLLNTAYSILFDCCAEGKENISAAKFICECAGIYGMIAGQSADLLYENSDCNDENALEFIYENKTSKLIVAALAVPTILHGGKYYVQMKEFGNTLGQLFQIIDDILDEEGNFSTLGKTVGKDKKEKKFTAVQLYGLEHSKLKCDVLSFTCHRMLDCIDGDVSFLRAFVDFVRAREY